MTNGLNTEASRPVDVRFITVESRPAAVIRARMPLSELGERLIPLYDRVYAQLAGAGVVPDGHNVLVMRGDPAAAIDVEVGVEVAAPFEPAGDLVSVATPGGQVATAVHWGGYEDLPAVHDAIVRWCDDQGRERAGVRWERYGDWDDDPDRRRTDVFYLLA